MNRAGHSVVAVVHGVRSPAVAPHTLRAVVSGHSQVLGEGDPMTEKREYLRVTERQIKTEVKKEEGEPGVRRTVEMEQIKKIGGR